MMDKRTVLAFVLIALVFFAWSFFFQPEPPPQTPAADTTAAAKNTPAAPQPPTAKPQPALAPRYAPLTEGNSRYVVIESPLYRALVNTRGGLLARFELKNYKTWYGAPVQLICDSAGFPGVLAVNFKTKDGGMVSTREMLFTIDGPDTIRLGENDSVTIVARLSMGASAPADTGGAPADTTTDTTAPPTSAPTIEKRFVFKGGSYGIGFDVTMRNIASELAQPRYELTWEKGLKYQEYNSVDESGMTKAMVTTSEDIIEVDAVDLNQTVRQDFAGPVNWAGLHVKYFAAAIIPATPATQKNVAVTGFALPADSSGVVESYDLTFGIPLVEGEPERFTLFVGPLEYDAASDFGIQAMLDFGARFIIRPIGEFFMLPLFNFLHTFIGNYGLVIIVFSILIRLILWPLSVPQIKSSRKMQLLQPKVAELREKYKDDPQRQQMETMGLYREFGINPVGGCLPMVLQLPILYALWGTLRSSIDLRQADFALWINDLATPDHIFNLPFGIPLLGDEISGLALIMGASLFIQQKMMITDPKQKAMIYFMPVLLTVAFNHLPSGLNLYYLTFNVLAIAQQIYMTKFSKNTMTLEQMRAEAKNKKKGWLSQKLEEAQKMAEMQSKAQGGGNSSGKKVEGRTAVEPRKRNEK